MEKESNVVVFGATGLVGSAVVEKLKDFGYRDVLTPTRKDVDLTNQSSVFKYFHGMKMVGGIDYVFLCAAHVGGIKANMTYPVDFIMNNIQIQTNVIKMCHRFDITKLMFLGSSCIYPKNCPQPIKEEYLLTGPFEQTNKPYALAKVAGIEMCEAYNRQYGTNFICAMPCNLYGPRDNYDLENSHVLPAMIRKFHEAKIHSREYIDLWGDGDVYREFMHSYDVADALIFLMNNYDAKPNDFMVNVGTGKDFKIVELVDVIKNVVFGKNYCKLVWNSSVPNGVAKKLLDVSKINSLGWKSSISLEDGIQNAYKWFVDNYDRTTR